MAYLIAYFFILAVLNIVVMRYAKNAFQVILLALAISAGMCFAYQTANYWLNGPDAFIVIAVAVQLTAGFIFSMIFGLVVLVRAR